MARQHYETLQEVFDDAYRGLAAQGFAQSKNSVNGISNICAYRGRLGLKCAIGQCIPDDLYAPLLEGVTPEADSPSQANVFDRIFGGGILRYDLSKLQRCHDEGSNPDLMKAYLAAFASKHSLTIPSIKGDA